jgi:hypothetical protein
MDKMIWLMFAVNGLYLFLSKTEDLGYITNNRRMWHWADAAGLTVFVGYSCYVNFGFTWLGAIVATDILTVWWIAFDIWLNLSRKLPVFYVGSGDMDLTVKWIADKINIGEDKLMFFIKLFVFLSMTFTTICFLK